jgi:hypothetical protein
VHENMRRPVIITYDSADEHSPEHWVALRRLVEETDQQGPEISASSSNRQMQVKQSGAC